MNTKKRRREITCNKTDACHLYNADLCPTVSVTSRIEEGPPTPPTALFQANLGGQEYREHIFCKFNRSFT